jgi:hypothetical protein
MTYPDGEVLTCKYDAGGKVRQGAGGRRRSRSIWSRYAQMSGPRTRAVSRSVVGANSLTIATAMTQVPRQATQAARG